MNGNGTVAVQDAATLAGFEAQADNGVAVREVGAASAVAREEAELKGAIFLARQFPRDEAKAYTKIMKSCKRATFAEGARYAFPRGGATVTGPSVVMAREIARCWGNIRSGLRVVSVDADTVHIRGYAYDMETNAYIEHEDKFAKMIQRKRNGRTEWVPPDERDLRELINRRGAILVRNAILQVVPPDVVEAALKQAENTLVNGTKGENRQDTIRRLAVAFDGLGVSTEMLAARLGHDLADTTPEEVADLRGIYTSIKDGNSRRDDYFDLQAGRKVQTESNAELNARLSDGDTKETTQAEIGAAFDAETVKAAGEGA